MAQQHTENKGPDRTKKQVLMLQVGYLAVLALFSMYRHVFPTPEYLFVLCVLVVVWSSKTRRFMVDALPFAMLLFSYQALRGYADDHALTHVHVTELIVYERALFGGVLPPQWLQELVLASRARFVILPLAHMFYLSHFVVPVVAGFAIWLKAREHYWRFIVGLMALSYAGFISYLLYPAAPPWLASAAGYIPGPRIISLVAFQFPTLIQLNPNFVAAMPSLHAAYPIYISMFCIWLWGRRAAWMVIIPTGVWFATVILGQHYVIDLLAGAVYGVATFFGVRYWARRHSVAQRTEAVTTAAVEERETAEVGAPR